VNDLTKARRAAVVGGKGQAAMAGKEYRGVKENQGTEKRMLA
jgi:hypothetical protein